MNNSSESPEEIKKWQDKLTKRLAEQLKRAELEPVSKSFANKLQEDFPGLPQDWEGVARYLVIGQGDRHKQIAQFLSSAQQYSADKSIEEPIKNLMAYLLQILVRKCHDEDDKGLTHIPVDQIHSVKLVSATRTTFPHIPNVSPTDNQEHENGQKNASFQNIGHFFPETGELENLDNICQAIANELLLSLGETPESSNNNLLDKLRYKLRAYRDAPENAPIQGLYVKQGIGHNPLQIDAVVLKLRSVLGDLLWLYIYGGQDSSQWLHAEEGDIEGLISRYNRDVVKQKPTQQGPVQENNMTTGINLNNIGSNTTVNIVSGTQTDSQVGQGNIQLTEKHAEQLLQLLGQLKNQATQADDVSKQDYALIDKTTQEIETEIQKKSGADKSVLTKAKAALSNFKNIASIAGSVEKITELLLPFIG